MIVVTYNDITPLATTTPPPSAVMDAPQYNPPAVVTSAASSSAPILFYTHMPAGSYVYNPPLITPVGTGGLPAPVQQGATIYQPAVYQQMPPLSQPGQMLYSPPVTGPYVAGSAGPSSSSASSGLSASTSAAYLSPGALPPSSRPSRPRLVSTVAASSVHYVAPSAPTLIAAPTAPEQVQHLFFICYLFVFICYLLFLIYATAGAARSDAAGGACADPQRRSGEQREEALCRTAPPSCPLRVIAPARSSKHGTHSMMYSAL